MATSDLPIVNDKVFDPAHRATGAQFSLTDATSADIRTLTAQPTGGLRSVELYESTKS